MADFCNQCSEEIWGVIHGDLSGLSSEEETRKRIFPIVLCEGCGPIQVDHHGNCLSDDCFEQHGKTKRIQKLKQYYGIEGV